MRRQGPTVAGCALVMAVVGGPCAWAVDGERAPVPDHLRRLLGPMVSAFQAPAVLYEQERGAGGGSPVMAAWLEDRPPLLLTTTGHSGRAASFVEVNWPEKRERAGRRLLLPSDLWPTHAILHAEPPDFTFLFPQREGGCPDPLDIVYRLNPSGWTTQPYQSLNRGFLGRLWFADVKPGAGQTRPAVRIIDGAGDLVANMELPEPMPRNAQPIPCGLMRGPERLWGCLGELEEESEPLRPAFRRIWAFDASLKESAPRPRLGAVWEIPTVGEFIDDEAREAGLIESTRFFPPALSASPETGLVVWCERVITSSRPGEGRLWELMHWTPSRSRMLAFRAQYRGPDGEFSWGFDTDGRWRERPWVRTSQSGRKLGLEPWLVAAISPDGQTVLWASELHRAVVSTAG
jgi:hypothetical protein